MYYSGNFIPFQMVSNQYGYNDFYMFNQNHVEVDFTAKHNKLFQYDPSYYYADGYRAIRVNGNFVSAHHSINRTIKIKNTKSEWCSNCSNETQRRKNEATIENRPQVAFGNNKYSNTLSKKEKLDIARTKTDSLKKNFRSKSINTLPDKTNDNQVKSDEVSDKRERSSRIDKFENKIEHKILADLSKDDLKKNEEPKLVRNLPRPPPPAPPLPLDLNFSRPNLALNRTNKVNKSVIGDTTKSFDAVVNELKFRLQKIKSPEEEENLSEKIPKLILTERLKTEEPNRKSIETKSEFKEIDSGIQSTDTMSKKLQVNSDSSLSSAPSHPSAKQNSLNRLKSTSKSNFGIVGIFKKNKLSPSLEQTSFYTGSNASRMSLHKQSENRTDLSSLSDFTDSIKCETLNDFAEQPSSSFKRSSTQNLNSKGKKVIFETVNTEPSPDNDGKKILKRNTFSEAKNLNRKDSDEIKQVEKPQVNRLVKSKSDYMNTNKLDRESHSCYDTLDLIKIESLGDLSNKQNSIAAFSTKNFFQNDKSKELDGSKIESSGKIDRELKKKLHVPYASSTLKSKSEIKINKAKQMSAVRPIAKSVFSTCTLKPNQFKSTSDILAEETQNSQVFNQIPSKYSSFVDLKKNKNQNMVPKNFNSLNRKNDSDLCENLINKASEYGIKLPDLLGRLKQNYQIGNEPLNQNKINKQFGIMNGIQSFNQYSISDFNEQYDEFDQYLDLMSSF